VGRGDEGELLRLCRAHRDAIRQHFAGWANLRAYEGVDAKDRNQVQFIINGLGKTAQLFRDKLGDSSLWDRMVGPPESSPFTRFQKALEQAKKLAAELEYQQAIDLMTNCLIEIKDLQGSGADNMRAYGHGMIGVAMFNSNRAGDAMPHFHQALSLCMKLGDREGVGVYLRQLYDAHRYLAQSREAAEYADRLAEFHKGAADEELWRLRGALVRAGEPLLRMVAERDGRVTELSQLSTIEGAVRFLLERNRPTLAPASVLCRKGNELAGQAKYDEALGFYRDAARADPYDPDPHYQAGITLLLLQRYPEAIEEYEKVNALAPGWFHIGSDLWVAQELLAGRLTHEAFFAAWAFENVAMEPGEKLKLIDQVIARFPQFSHLYLQRGLALEALDRKQEAIAALDQGLATDPEPDIHSRLLAQRAALSGQADQRRLFSEILEMPTANMMSRTFAEVVLRRVEKG